MKSGCLGRALKAKSHPTHNNHKVESLKMATRYGMEGNMRPSLEACSSTLQARNEYENLLIIKVLKKMFKNPSQWMPSITMG